MPGANQTSKGSDMLLAAQANLEKNKSERPNIPKAARRLKMSPTKKKEGEKQPVVIAPEVIIADRIPRKNTSASLEETSTQVPPKGSDVSPKSATEANPSFSVPPVPTMDHGVDPPPEPLSDWCLSLIEQRRLNNELKSKQKPPPPPSRKEQASPPGDASRLFTDSEDEEPLKKRSRTIPTPNNPDSSVRSASKNPDLPGLGLSEPELQPVKPSKKSKIRGEEAPSTTNAKKNTTPAIPGSSNPDGVPKTADPSTPSSLLDDLYLDTLAEELDDDPLSVNQTDLVKGHSVDADGGKLEKKGIRQGDGHSEASGSSTHHLVVVHESDVHDAIKELESVHSEYKFGESTPLIQY